MLSTLLSNCLAVFRVCVCAGTPDATGAVIEAKVTVWRLLVGQMPQQCDRFVVQRTLGVIEGVCGVAGRETISTDFSNQDKVKEVALVEEEGVEDRQREIRHSHHGATLLGSWSG